MPLCFCSAVVQSNWPAFSMSCKNANGRYSLSARNYFTDRTEINFRIYDCQRLLTFLTFYHKSKISSLCLQLCCCQIHCIRRNISYHNHNTKSVLSIKQPSHISLNASDTASLWNVFYVLFSSLKSTLLCSSGSNTSKLSFDQNEKHPLCTLTG